MTSIETEGANAPGETVPVPRPQPLGILDGPPGLLLVGPGEGVEELLRDLAAGREPTAWPAAATCLAAAWRGDIDGAVAALGDDAVSAVNRLVLQPREDTLATARDATLLDHRLQSVVAAAAYIGGLSDDAPQPDGLDGEFAVLAYTVGAARSIEFRDGHGATRRLTAALHHAEAAGPVLAARVLAQLAERSHGPAAIDLYSRALTVLQGTERRDLVAALSLERALLSHELADVERHRLQPAVRDYQGALSFYRKETHPSEFALANSNLAVALLSLPTSQSQDQIRLGVAVQSLRSALEVYSPSSDPDRWSSCQMNLANALQYLPSTHRRENLEEAVDLYEEVLSVRSAARDPLGYARVLANQANALAHLAAFDQAEERYREAGRLFGLAGDTDASAVVARQLVEIDESRRAAIGGAAR